MSVIELVPVWDTWFEKSIVPPGGFLKKMWGVTSAEHRRMEFLYQRTAIREGLEDIKFRAIVFLIVFVLII